MYWEFIQIAYNCTIPLLFVLLWIDPKRATTYYRLIVVSNLLLIGYSIFLIRQLIGLFQLSTLFPQTHTPGLSDIDLSMIRLYAVMLLPFFTLIKKIRESLFFALIMLVLLFWNAPVQNWNLYGLWIKIPAYISLFSTAYALLWLFHRMPDSIRK